MNVRVLVLLRRICIQRRRRVGQCALNGKSHAVQLEGVNCTARSCIMKKPSNSSVSIVSLISPLFSAEICAFRLICAVS
jgi:hypothetical protein